MPFIIKIDKRVVRWPGDGLSGYLSLNKSFEVVAAREKADRVYLTAAGAQNFIDLHPQYSANGYDLSVEAL